MRTEDLAEALRSGALPNPDAVLQVRESRLEPSGTRGIDITPMGGIGVRLLPDRGLDIGQAWFGGVPLAWVSETGEAPPVAELSGMSWGDAFGGGLVTTCGLRNVGMPSEGRGLHGTFSHLPAHDVAIHRSVEAGEVTVTGTIVDDREDPTLRVQRTITVALAEGRIVLEDVTTNEGDEETPAPILYHCNFGYPLWSGDAILELTEVETVARDADSADVLDSWHTPPPHERRPERVHEHRNVEGRPGWARVVNAAVGVAVMITWDARQLPRINQWLDSNPGMAVLGVEPSNCTTRGRAHDRDQGTLPTIRPDEVRRTGLVIEAVAYA